MRPIAGAAATAVAALAVFSTPAIAQSNGYTTGAVNQRTGPGTGYSVIQVIPPGARLQVYDCTLSRSWCEARYAGKRGWVSGRNLPPSRAMQSLDLPGTPFGPPN